MKPAPRVFLIAFLLSCFGCAHTAVRWKAAPTPGAVAGPIFVLISPAPALPPESVPLGDHLLASVRETGAQTELLHGTEPAAAQLAVRRGAAYLLNARVLEWRDADTQYSGEPDRIRIDLRLIDLQHPGTVRELQLSKTGARFAFHDAPASRLLNGSLRDAVRRLLSGAP